MEDYRGQPAHLNYLRTKDGKEVDFALTVDDRIKQIIEVKLSDHRISKPLKYFAVKYGFTAIQVVKYLRQEFISEGIEVRKGIEYLKELWI